MPASVVAAPDTVTGPVNAAPPVMPRLVAPAVMAKLGVVTSPSKVRLPAVRRSVIAVPTVTAPSNVIAPELLTVGIVPGVKPKASVPSAVAVPTGPVTVTLPLLASKCRFSTSALVACTGPLKLTVPPAPAPPAAMTSTVGPPNAAEVLFCSSMKLVPASAAPPALPSIAMLPPAPFTVPVGMQLAARVRRGIANLAADREKARDRPLGNPGRGVAGAVEHDRGAAGGGGDEGDVAAVVAAPGTGGLRAPARRVDAGDDEVHGRERDVAAGAGQSCDRAAAFAVDPVLRPAREAAGADCAGCRGQRDGATIAAIHRRPRD